VARQGKVVLLDAGLRRGKARQGREMERMAMMLARRNKSLLQAGGGRGGIRVVSGAFSTQQQVEDPPVPLNMRDTAAHVRTLYSTLFGSSSLIKPS
jgi:hypothetical protein